MPAAIRSMSSALMDRVFKHPAPDPETLAIYNEKTSENQQAQKEQEQKDDMKDEMRERIWTLLKRELKALKFRQKGDFAAYWTDECGYSDADVGELLDLSESAVRKTKCLQLKLPPCLAHQCPGTLDCAHRRGEKLWNAIAERIIGELRQEEEEGEKE